VGGGRAPGVGFPNTKHVVCRALIRAADPLRAWTGMVIGAKMACVHLFAQCRSQHLCSGEPWFSTGNGTDHTRDLAG